MEKYNILGERIKYLRQKQGLSQAELARMLNCTQAALSQYERGIREPSLSDLGNIADTLATTTDYLLGRTEILNEDISIRNIGDYLGLCEEAIERLHTMYIKYKKETDEDRVLEGLKDFSGAVPTDKNYTRDYHFIRWSSEQELDGYRKVLNEFICSREFWVLISGLRNNLSLERSVYDLLRIVDKQYDNIETVFPNESPAEWAYALSEMGEDHVKNYSLNMFEIQTAVMDFCQRFTKIEEIKKREQSEDFYRKVIVGVYLATRPMFEKGEYSIVEMETALSYIRKQVGEQIEDILSNK